jgi:hypothetical protein
VARHLWDHSSATLSPNDEESSYLAGTMVPVAVQFVYRSRCVLCALSGFARIFLARYGGIVFTHVNIVDPDVRKPQENMTLSFADTTLPLAARDQNLFLE